METLQSELIDERKGQILRSFESDERKVQIGKSLESAGVGSIGLLRLGGGLPPFPLPRGYNMVRGPGTPFNYDEIIAKEFPPARVDRNIRRPLIPKNSVNNGSQFRRRELDWRRTHAEILGAFANQWVVLEKEQIVAHGEDPVRVINDAKSKGVRTPYIFFVEPKTENVIAIGL